jgi:hypothetical protein
VARAIGVALLSGSLFGCSFPSDYFGSRAIEYNREAEDATLSAMLLNIIRASQRRPMQFTGLQSVTGTSSTSGSIGGSDQKVHNTPFVIPQTPTSTFISRAITGSANASASISGGPTFTVPVLDTQEFYQGILQPVPLSVIDFFFQEGFPPELLADLFILTIEVTRIDPHGDCQQFIFKNNVADDLQFGQFQAMVDYLMTSGFISERVSRSTPYGPAIPTPGKGDAARAVDAFAHASQAGLDVKKSKGGGYNLEKKSSELRTCFAYKGGAFPEWLKAKDTSIFCGHFADKEAMAKGGDDKPAGPACVPRQMRRVAHAERPPAKPTSSPKSASEPKTATEPKPETPADGTAAPAPNASPANEVTGLQGVHNTGGESEFRGIALADPVIDRIAMLQRAELDGRKANGEPPIPADRLFPVEQFRGARISMKIQTRSTEGILYYLGEIVRRQLTPEAGGPRVIKTKAGLNYGAYPMEECGDQAQIDNIRPLGRGGRYQYDSQIPVQCQSIFVVTQGPSVGDSVVTVAYNGGIYSIPHSIETGGRSSQVTELVKQVLNLNTSAKQLPSTTVISVVGAQ